MQLLQIYTDFVQKLLAVCRQFYGGRLISFCLFGSIARGTVTPTSDVDFLLVIEPLPDGRLQRVKEFEHVESTLAAEKSELRKQGVSLELSPIFKRPFEVQQGSLLFLDILEDGKMLFDRDNFLKDYLTGWEKKLRAQGAHRVMRGEGWHWVLKEPFQFGEEIEL